LIEDDHQGISDWQTLAANTEWRPQPATNDHAPRSQEHQVALMTV